MDNGFDSLFGGEGPTPTPSALGLRNESEVDDLNVLENVDNMSMFTTNSDVDGNNV